MCAVAKTRAPFSFQKCQPARSPENLASQVLPGASVVPESSNRPTASALIRLARFLGRVAARHETSGASDSENSSGATR